MAAGAIREQIKQQDDAITTSEAEGQILNPDSNPTGNIAPKTPARAAKIGVVVKRAVSIFPERGTHRHSRRGEIVWLAAKRPLTKTANMECSSRVADIRKTFALSRKIAGNPKLREFVREHLKQRWSPPPDQLPSTR